MLPSPAIDSNASAVVTPRVLTAGEAVFGAGVKLLRSL